jgi:predicted O-methyltransferase YrrM
MIINKPLVDAIDLTPYVHLITRNDHKPIFLAPAGENHYKLLAYIATQINDELIIELGTHEGTSSTALAINKSNKIVTFDVKNMYTVAEQPSNVERKIGNIFNLGMQDMLLQSALIFLDTAHRGDFEWEVYSFLKENNYKGILVLDDIHWNKPMKEFWNKIDTLKYDITNLGHGICPDGIAGTGIVDFSNQVVIDDKN